jgi:hypothetical protein
MVAQKIKKLSINLRKDFLIEDYWLGSFKNFYIKFFKVFIVIIKKNL